MFETRKGGREAWSSENKRGERKGMGLRGEGSGQLQRLCGKFGESLEGLEQGVSWRGFTKTALAALWGMV